MSPSWWQARTRAASSSRIPPSKQASDPLVVALCNTTDYVGSTSWDQIERARLFSCATRGQSAVKLVALTYGFGAEALHILQVAGYRVIDASAVPTSTFSLSRKSRPHRSGKPLRSDSVCTAVKLLAWNLTQYTRLLLSDSDVLLRVDPLPW